MSGLVPLVSSLILYPRFFIFLSRLGSCLWLVGSPPVMQTPSRRCFLFFKNFKMSASLWEGIFLNLLQDLDCSSSHTAYCTLQERALQN